MRAGLSAASAAVLFAARRLLEYSRWNDER